MRRSSALVIDSSCKKIVPDTSKSPFFGNMPHDYEMQRILSEFKDEDRSIFGHGLLCFLHKTMVYIKKTKLVVQALVLSIFLSNMMLRNTMSSELATIS